MQFDVKNIDEEIVLEELDIDDTFKVSDGRRAIVITEAKDIHGIIAYGVGYEVDGYQENDSEYFESLLKAKERAEFLKDTM